MDALDGSEFGSPPSPPTVIRLLIIYRKAAVSAIIGASFGAAGQRCMALSVAVLVGAAKSFVDDIVEGARQLKVCTFLHATTPPVHGALEYDRCMLVHCGKPADNR